MIVSININLMEQKMHLEASSKIAIKGFWKNGYISSVFSEIVTPVLTSNHRLHIIKPIEIVGNTKIPAEAQHNKNRNAKHPHFLF